MEGRELTQSLLNEIVRRVVDVAHPDRIILFGSAARGQLGPDSDIDLLVVKSGVMHRRRLAQEIHLNKTSRPFAIRSERSSGLLFGKAERSMPPERRRPGDPAEWLRRARSNLHRARAYRQQPEVLYEDFCFDAQQAAEKAIKTGS